MNNNHNTKDSDDQFVTYCHIDGRVERLPRGAPAPSWYGSSVILPQNLISDKEGDEIDRSWGMIAAERGIEAADEWRHYYVRSLLRSKKTSTTNNTPMNNDDNTNTNNTVTYEVTIQKVLATETVDNGKPVPVDTIEFTTTVSVGLSNLASQELLRWLMNTAVRRLFNGNAAYSVGLISQQGFDEKTFEARFQGTVLVTYPVGVLVPGFVASNSQRIPGDFLFKIKPEVPPELSDWLEKPSSVL